MAAFIGLLMILASFRMCNGHGRYLSSVYGEVGRGNITHFSMAYHGTVLLELTSLTGDCDLYVSQFTIRPNYEPHSYCLQSMTCGIDTIVVPKSFKRPIGIGIFGYPTHTNCKYHLLFYEIDDVLDVFNNDYFSDPLTPKNEKSAENDSNKEEGKVKAAKGEEGSGTGKSAEIETGAGEKEGVQEIKEKRRTKKLEESEKDKNDKMKRRRKSYEGGGDVIHVEHEKEKEKEMISFKNWIINLIVFIFFFFIQILYKNTIFGIHSYLSYHHSHQIIN